jgi:hypothetical protein
VTHRPYGWRARRPKTSVVLVPTPLRMGRADQTTTILGDRAEQLTRGPLAIWWLLPGAEPGVCVLDRAEVLLGRGEDAEQRFEVSGVRGGTPDCTARVPSSPFKIWRAPTARS